MDRVRRWGQSKTLIRLRALWGGACAPSFAANAERPIFACCCFIISSNRWKSLCRMRTGEIQIIARNKYVNIHKKVYMCHIPIVETKLILRICVVRSWSSLSANLFSMFYCIQQFCQRTKKTIIRLRGCTDQSVQASDLIVKWKNGIYGNAQSRNMFNI